ncbi:ABC transporter ATP-binding protein [Priestia megaterium]
MNLIKVRNLKKKYLENKQSLEVLHDINLDLSSGEMIAIIGESGSGKTTLLNILGLLDPDFDGEYIHSGINIMLLSETQKAKIRNENLGFLLQDSPLIKKLTVEKNILLPLIYSHEKNAYKYGKEKCATLSKKFNIHDILKKNAKKISGGQRSRVGLVRALINDPKILLADEPTGALDSKNSENILKVFLEFKNKGNAIISVTHDLEFAKQHDKIYLLKNGSLDLVKKE